MSLDDRFVDPLGFQVTSYRKDQEVLTPESQASASAAAAVPAGVTAGAAGAVPLTTTSAYYPGASQPAQTVAPR